MLRTTSVKRRQTPPVRLLNPLMPREPGQEIVPRKTAAPGSKFI